MVGIYKYIPDTNQVSRVHSVVAVPFLQFVQHVMLSHMCNMYCTFTFVLPK